MSYMIVSRSFEEVWPESPVSSENYYTDFIFEHYNFVDMWDYGNHAHPMMQYSMVLNDVMEYSVDSHQYIIQPGNGFFVNYNRFHRAIATNNNQVEYLSLLFSPDFVSGSTGSATAIKYADPFISSESSNCLLLNCQDPTAKSILDTMQEIQGIVRHRSFGYELTVKSLAVRIWLNTILLLRESVQRNDAQLPSMDKMRIDQIITYIHLYYRSKLTLQDLASCANISQGECCRLFKRMLNTSPIEYLNRYRISQAQLMLRTTHSSILQIAQETGFPSINHFISMFKRFSDCTPRAYRTKMQIAPSYPEAVNLPHLPE